MNITDPQRLHSRDLLAFIDASPSPWHAVATAEERLRAAGFTQLHERERWHLQAGGRHYVVRGGSSLIALIVGQGDLAECGYRLVGAHTDSPGLRLKPKAAHACEGHVRLGVEIYGGPILATFADRDLSLAGRVHLRSRQGLETRLVRFHDPLVRLPNLAIHMNREVNEQGLKLHKQNELPLMLGRLEKDLEADGVFMAALAAEAGVAAKDILSLDMNVYDTQPGAFWGAAQEFIADSQLDNLASCHAALTALIATASPEATAVCALFDHEEVGSDSAVGAGGSFVQDVLGRIAGSGGLDAEAQRMAHAASFFISADMAHAWNPNFPAAYEPQHRVLVNGGPVIKTHAGQRYSTGGDTAARFMLLCEQAGVPCQQYAHRTDLGCGSTIGPMVAARLGMPAVDVGAPMWAMHSLRESAGVIDQAWMAAVLAAAFSQ